MKRLLVAFALIIVAMTGYSQSVVTRDSLLNVFITGARPTQQHFASWINSFLHTDESIPIDYGRGIFSYGSGNTINEQDGNVRLSFWAASRWSIAARESGTWYNMLSLPTHASLTGRWLSTTHDFAGNLGHIITNSDTVGQVHYMLTLPTDGGDTAAFSLFKNRAEINTTDPLYINGTLWPPSGGGSSLWTDLGSGRIGFTSVNTRVGIGVTPTFRLHVLGSDDLFGTINAAFIGNSGSDGVSFRNDGSVVMSGDQTVLVFDETITTGPGSQIQWKRSGSTLGQFGIDDNSLVLSTLSGGDYGGIVRVDADTFAVKDGALRIYSTAGSGLTVFEANDETGKVFTGKPNQYADVTFRKNSSNAADAVAVRIDANPVSTIITPSSDFSALVVDADSINPSGTDDVIGITINMDTMQGLARTTDGVNPERTYPFRIYRGFNEKRGVPKIMTTEGDADIVASIYGGWVLASTSLNTSVGSATVSSASYVELTDPSVDTSLYNEMVAINENEIRISYDTIFYEGVSSQYARYDRDVEIELRVSMHHTTGASTNFAVGISKNGADIATERTYVQKTAVNGDGISTWIVTVQDRIEPGDWFIPKIISNSGGGVNVNFYECSMSIKSID